jgi:hypothetical protein
LVRFVRFPCVCHKFIIQTMSEISLPLGAFCAFSMCLS